MRILDRYLLNGFFHALLYCLSLFFILFVVIDVFNNLDEFLRNGISLNIIFTYYLYSMPGIFVQIIPVAVLVSLLYILGNLARHNEILAMKASGISAFHILAPYLFMGTLLSFTVFLVSERIVPKASVTSTSIMEGLIEKGKKRMEERAIKNVTLFTKNNSMVFAREYELHTSTLYDVVMFEDTQGRALQSKITARKAKFENGSWYFYESIRDQVNHRGELVGDPKFEDRVKVNLEATPEEFLKESSLVENMNTHQLNEYMQHLKGTSKKLANKLMVDFHYKIAFPFVSFVVILIGAPLAMQTERSGAIRGIGTSVGVVMIYYGIVSVCLAMGKGGILPPFIAAWFSNFFFVIVGLILIRNNR